MLPNSPRIASICIGKTYDYPGTTDKDPLTREWRSGFVKLPVAGLVSVTKNGIEGDKQADDRYHGGEDQAVLMYANQHYPAWRQELNHPLISPGGFAENLTVDRLTEDSVCIGDQYQIGDVVLEVSSVRIPCWKITRRWQISGLTERVRETGRTGWYARVLRPGEIHAGQTIHLISRAFPEWTVSRAYQVYLDPAAQSTDIKDLANCQALSERWKTRLLAKS